jgi:hypothetical protein
MATNLRRDDAVFQAAASPAAIEYFMAAKAAMWLEAKA